jgi:long-chain acyl-CoA synthetase
MKKLFFEKLDKFSHRNALITETGRAIKYKELLLTINKVEKLIKYKRSRVFLLADNSYEFIFSYYALLRKKSIIFLLNSSLEEDKINRLIKIYKPYFIFDCGGLFKKKIKSFIEIEGIEKLKIFENKTKEKFQSSKKLAQLISTSGSTGSPKFVKQTFENIEINTADIVNALHLKKDDKTITTMNPSYTYGLSKINTHIYTGGTIILNKKTVFDKDFWNKVNDFKVTNFGGVPFFFEMLKKLNFHNFHLKNLKHITQAGGKLNLELLKYFEEKRKKLKIKFYVMYGQTEAGPRISILNDKFLKKKIESVGKPIGNNKLWIEDENNKIIKKPNIAGKLFCKGKNVMLGYALNLKDLKIDRFNNVIDTGDMAYRDQDGFYYIVGRSKRIVKPFGLRIDLTELENYLKNKKFNDCVCIGNDKKINIYSKHSNHLEMKNVVLSKLSLKRDIVNFLEDSEIPRDKNGKINYII